MIRINFPERKIVQVVIPLAATSGGSRKAGVTKQTSLSSVRKERDKSANRLPSCINNPKKDRQVTLTNLSDQTCSTYCVIKLLIAFSLRLLGNVVAVNRIHHTFEKRPEDSILGKEVLSVFHLFSGKVSSNYNNHRGSLP